MGTDIGRQMRDTNERAARDLMRVLTSQSRRQAEHASRKSYIGKVVNSVGPVIEIAGHRYERTSYRVAKGVQLKNLIVGDEILMTQTANGIFVATQVMRVFGDDDDNMVISGALTATTVSADLVIADGLTVNGNLSAANGAFSNNVTIQGDLTVVGTLLIDELELDSLVVAELSVTDRVGFFGTAPILPRPDWTITNKTVQRTIDANNMTLDEALDALATLVSDLQDYGLLRGTHD